MWKGMENCARKRCLFLCTILFQVTWVFWKMLLLTIPYLRTLAYQESCIDLTQQAHTLYLTPDLPFPLSHHGFKAILTKLIVSHICWHICLFKVQSEMNDETTIIGFCLTMSLYSCHSNYQLSFWVNSLSTSPRCFICWLFISIFGWGELLKLVHNFG